MASHIFESDLILRTIIVVVSSDVVFPFIVENKSFRFRHSYSRNASLFTFIKNFLVPLYNKDYRNF